MSLSGFLFNHVSCWCTSSDPFIILFVSCSGYRCTRQPNERELMTYYCILHTASEHRLLVIRLKLELCCCMFLVFSQYLLTLVFTSLLCLALTDPGSLTAGEDRSPDTQVKEMLKSLPV